MEALNLCFFNHIRLIRAALPLLRKSSAPSVLTITSISAKQPIPDLVLSNTLRAGVLGLTKTLSQELGNEGIRFNSILPGWTKTDRSISLMGDRAAKNNTSPDIEMQKQAEVNRTKTNGHTRRIRECCSIPAFPRRILPDRGHAPGGWWFV